ncbi:MAG: hypothetical protein ACK481_04470 [Candidatus Melainabacteria bacterium]|jgi:thymidylate kinase
MDPILLLFLIVITALVSIAIFFDLDKKLERKRLNTIGKLIVIEGFEGSGKAKLVKLLKENMPSDWTYSKEPYSIDISPDNWTKEKYQLDRETHIEKKIMPILQQKKVLITNRYWMSGVVYDGQDAEAFLSIWPDPDLIIWLDTEPSTELAEEAKTSLDELFKLRSKYENLFAMLGKEHYVKIVKINPQEMSDDLILETLSLQFEEIIPGYSQFAAENTEYQSSLPSASAA